MSSQMSKIYKTEIIARAQASKLTKKTGLMYEVCQQETGFAVRELSHNVHKVGAPVGTQAPSPQQLIAHHDELQLIATVPEASAWAVSALQQIDEEVEAMFAPADVQAQKQIDSLLPKDMMPKSSSKWAPKVPTGPRVTLQAVVKKTCKTMVYLDFQARKGVIIEYRFMELLQGDWEIDRQVTFTLPLTQVKSHKLVDEPQLAALAA